MIRTILATALLVIASIGVAPAQDRRALREACTGDARKFCATVQRGGGRIVQCLRDHNAELTPACRERLAAARPR